MCFIDVVVMQSMFPGRMTKPVFPHTQQPVATLPPTSVHSVASMQLQPPKQQLPHMQTHLQRQMLESQPKQPPVRLSAPPAPPPSGMGARQLQVEDALQYLDEVLFLSINLTKVRIGLSIDLLFC